MRARTELFLYLVAEFLDGVVSFPVRSRFRPFDSWGYADDFDRQIHRLRQRALLEDSAARERRDRVYRLTEAGRIALPGGADPQVRWSRPWDGTWRLVAFDMPESQRTERAACRRELRRLKFGCLQGSVWLSPDPMTELRAAMEDAAINTRRLLLIEGRPAAGESDAEIVRNAWDFASINKLYARYRKHLGTLPGPEAPADDIRAQLPVWTRREYVLWKNVIARDPFLPAALLPADYEGQAAVVERTATFRRARTLFAQSVPH